MLLAGRAEDAAALRDAWYLRQAGADPGPAGTIFGAWRQLARQPPVATRDRLETILNQLGLHWDVEALAALCEHIDDLARSEQPAPFAASAIAARVVAMRPNAELLARRPSAGAKPALAAAAAAADGASLWSGFSRRGRRWPAHPARGREF